MKEILSLAAFCLAVIGYSPYIRAALKRTIDPHIYSWLVWGTVTMIAFSLQVRNGGGTGSVVTCFAGILQLTIFFISIGHKHKDITTSDRIFFALAIAAIPLWLFARQSKSAVLLISAIDLLGFLPTIRKAYRRPQSEVSITYLMAALRQLLIIFALRRYVFETAFYPSTIVATNLSFFIFLRSRK